MVRYFILALLLALAAPASDADNDKNRGQVVSD